MATVDTKEIIGLARKDNWENVRNFIKQIVSETLNADIGYMLVALGAQLSDSDDQELSLMILEEEQIKEIDRIEDFEMLSLYQSDSITNDHLSLSIEDGLIIFIAKFMGPYIDHAGSFDFSLQIDSLNAPLFTNTAGQELNCQDVVNLFKDYRKEEPEKKKSEKEDSDDEIIELSLFEKQTGKNAIWQGSVTKGFKKWQSKMRDRYSSETNGNPIYDDSLTEGYVKFLEDLLKDKKLANKNSKKKPKSAPAKKKDNKSPKKSEKLEMDIFEKKTGKNALWQGSVTKGFKKWQGRVRKKYIEKTRSSPTYDGALTEDYVEFLNQL